MKYLMYIYNLLYNRHIIYQFLINLIRKLFTYLIIFLQYLHHYIYVNIFHLNTIKLLHNPLFYLEQIIKLLVRFLRLSNIKIELVYLNNYNHKFHTYQLIHYLLILYYLNLIII